jgi:ArsR family transcriptional regulator
MKQRKAVMPPACCTLNIAGKEQERLVTMFKGLGNPIRFEIIKFLVTHTGCITGDIVRYLPIAQATVSQHLKVLKDAGWISGWWGKSFKVLNPRFAGDLNFFPFMCRLFLGLDNRKITINSNFFWPGLS